MDLSGKGIWSWIFGGDAKKKRRTELLDSPGSLSNLITMRRHNMVAISKVGNFRTRLSLSEILSDLIRCKLVRYPWFCSARPRSFTCFKMADVYHAYWSKFHWWSGSYLFCYGAGAQKESAKLQNTSACTDKTAWFIQYETCLTHPNRGMIGKSKGFEDVSGVASLVSRLI